MFYILAHWMSFLFETVTECLNQETKACNLRFFRYCTNEGKRLYNHVFSQQEAERIVSNMYWKSVHIHSYCVCLKDDGIFYHY